jgi:RNase P subunit RPR2
MEKKRYAVQCGYCHRYWAPTRKALVKPLDFNSNKIVVKCQRCGKISVIVGIEALLFLDYIE